MSLRTRRELFTIWRDALNEPAAPEPWTPPRPAKDRLPPFLRPPGAVAEADFVSLCERCGKCADACPHDAILPLGPAYGDADGTPAVLPRDQPCLLCDGLPCAAACPSGALEVIPIAEVRMGTARLAPERCWAVQGQPCDYCVKECPLGEAALRFEDGRPVVGDACVGCGMCVAICPTTPVALSVEAAHEQADRVATPRPG